jgi:hypothetical protein
MRPTFILDNNVKHLKTLLPRGQAKTTVECGLRPEADDIAVIGLAYERKAILVTSDVGIVKKSKRFQSQRSVCLFGLLILPDGLEQQLRLLNDIRSRRKVFRHQQFERTVTWNNIREENLFVNARMAGQPGLQDLCDCDWED